MHLRHFSAYFYSENIHFYWAIIDRNALKNESITPRVPSDTAPDVIDVELNVLFRTMESSLKQKLELLELLLWP